MSAVIETKQLAAVAPTGFPVSYEEARQAIAKCESPFECRTMADQAAAMAVYARMRDDTDLLNRAVRLQAWAARRWGELDKALHPDRRQENLKQNDRKAVDQNSRISAEIPKCGQPQFGGQRPPAPDGTTEYQRVVSRRLAAIPEPEFTRQVESPNPPTVTQLASQGTVKRTVVLDPEFARSESPWAAVEDDDVREACETLERFAKYCERNESELIARAVGATEAHELRRLIAITDQWLDSLIANLSAEW